jgi:predicted enzyme related to lactoylglutathione lyase
MIKEIAFVVYPVKDLGRARTFYEETLGLKVGEDFGEMVEYDIAGTAFAINANPYQSAPASSVAFEVDNLDAEVAKLKAAGVAFQGGINESPVCRMALFQDPDQNTLCLHQRKSK